jgi:tetratricopeptide (TPR) repeat protein
MSASPTEPELARPDPSPSADAPGPSGANPSGVAEGASPGAPPNRRSVRPFIILGAVLLAGVAAWGVGQHLWVEKHFAAAERALERRDFSEARAQLARCRALRGDDADDELLSVRVARRSCAYEETDAQIRTYLQKYPRDFAIEREIRLFQVQRGNLPDVDAVLTGALGGGDAADPWELEAGIIGGVTLLFPAFAQGGTAPGGNAIPLLLKVQRGVDLWLRLRPDVPDQVQGLFWRGLTRVFANEQFGSQADFRAALALDPTHRDARFHLALVLQLDAPAEAIGHLEQLRRRFPDDTRVKSTLATLYRNRGRIREAEQVLDEILAADPDHVPALIERGSLALDQGQADRARQWLFRAQRRAPEDAGANFALAAALRATGREDEAKAYHERAQRIQDELRKPGNPTAPPGPGGRDRPPGAPPGPRDWGPGVPPKARNP